MPEKNKIAVVLCIVGLLVIVSVGSAVAILRGEKSRNGLFRGFVAVLRSNGATVSGVNFEERTIRVVDLSSIRKSEQVESLMLSFKAYHLDVLVVHEDFNSSELISLSGSLEGLVKNVQRKFAGRDE